MYVDRSVIDFLDELASPSPIPGGGSAAALNGALGAALVSMVANLTVGREKYRDAEDEMREALARAEELRGKLLENLEADIQAYGNLSAAFKLPKASDEEKAARRSAIQEALIVATKVPLEITRLCGEVMKVCPPVAQHGNLSAVSDVGVAVCSAEAGLSSAALNVKINLASIKDQTFVEEVRATLSTYVDGSMELRETVMRQVEARI
jgi:methenyltetrahydrofolate cyclohydrolase